VQRSLFVFIALFSALCAASAQASDVVRVQVPKSIEATAGKATVAEVQVIVRPGFHVQANPVRNRFLKPIVLEVPSTRVVATGAPIYPPNKILRLEGSDEDLVIYDGTFHWIPVHHRTECAEGTSDPAGDAALPGLRRQALFGEPSIASFRTSSPPRSSRQRS
jgi:hypothetical protein